MRKTVCVDLDGTLADYRGWKGLDHIGEPRPGAVAFSHHLIQMARVVIFTTRCTVAMDDRPEGVRPEQLAGLVKDWLDYHGFAYDEIYSGQGKPVAAAYVDDRGVHIPSNPEAADYVKVLNTVWELLQA